MTKFLANLGLEKFNLEKSINYKGGCGMSVIDAQLPFPRSLSPISETTVIYSVTNNVDEQNFVGDGAEALDLNDDGAAYLAFFHRLGSGFHINGIDERQVAETVFPSGGQYQVRSPGIHQRVATQGLGFIERVLDGDLGDYAAHGAFLNGRLSIARSISTGCSR
jgi:hypothetical protein